MTKLLGKVRLTGLIQFWYSIKRNTKNKIWSSLHKKGSLRLVNVFFVSGFFLQLMFTRARSHCLTLCQLTRVRCICSDIFRAYYRSCLKLYNMALPPCLEGGSSDTSVFNIMKIFQYFEIKTSLIYFFPYGWSCRVSLGAVEI